MDAVWGLVMWGCMFFGAASLFATLNFPAPNDIVYFVLVAGTSLMVGWTILLIWGGAGSNSRRGTLLITVCPVMGLIILFEMIGFARGNRFISLTRFLSSSMILIYGVGYYFAHTLARSSPE